MTRSRLERAAAVVEAIRDGRFDDVPAELGPELRRRLTRRRLEDAWRRASEDAGGQLDARPP